MKPEEKTILIRKRYVELECLGISVPLYYKAIKLIERHVYVVIKDLKIFIFKKNDLGLHGDEAKGKYFDQAQITQLLVETFGLDGVTAFNIYNEWIREKVIHCKMTQDVNKYWDFLCLPATYKDIDRPDDYNF